MNLGGTRVAGYFTCEWQGRAKDGVLRPSRLYSPAKSDVQTISLAYLVTMLTVAPIKINSFIA